MKIALITRDYPPTTCGVGDYAQCLAREFADRGHQPLIVTTQVTGMPASAQEGGIQVERMVARWDLRGVWAIVKAVQSAGADVVTVQYSPYAFARYGVSVAVPLLVALLRLLTVTRIVMVFHETYIAWPSKLISLRARLALGMVALLQRLQAVSLACLSHAIIVTAQDRREAIRRLVPIADRKVFVVPVGFNCPLYTLSNGEKKRLRAELGINEGDTVLLTFGTLQQAKRYEELIQAVSQLVRDGCSCKLVWLGDLDKYMTPGTQQRLERIMAFIDREGIASHIKLIGYCPPDEVSRYFNFADIYVHLDQSGASSKSGTLIGALAHGLPVVAADGLGADGFFRTDENIVLVPDTHAEHLADGIQALINAESLRHKLGQTARQFFELHFTWPMIAQQYEQVFGNLRRK